MRKLVSGIAASILLVSVSACGNNSASPSTTSDPSASAPTNEPSESPNVIQQDAAKAYRDALLLSQTSATSDGLTELWYDSDSSLSQVQVQDPVSKKFVLHDLTENTAVYVDESAMMPTRLTGELDGLIEGGLDIGSVTSSQPGVIVIVNTMDSVVYRTTYTLDPQGRIAKAILLADDEPLGEIDFKFAITTEGKAALKLAAETN
jgi:hypothetical protein